MIITLSPDPWGFRTEICPSLPWSVSSGCFCMIESAARRQRSSQSQRCKPGVLSWAVKLVVQYGFRRIRGTSESLWIPHTAGEKVNKPRVSAPLPFPFPPVHLHVAVAIAFLAFFICTNSSVTLEVWKRRWALDRVRRSFAWYMLGSNQGRLGLHSVAGVRENRSKMCCFSLCRVR